MRRLKQGRVAAKRFVLLVDDDPESYIKVNGEEQWQLNRFLRDTLRPRGYELLVADSLKKVRKFAKRKEVLIALLDGNLSANGKFKDDFGDDLKRRKAGGGVRGGSLAGRDIGTCILPHKKFIALSGLPPTARDEREGHYLGYLDNCVAVVPKEGLREVKADYLANLIVSVVENYENKGVGVSWNPEVGEIFVADGDGKRLAKIPVSTGRTFGEGIYVKTLTEVVSELFYKPREWVPYDHVYKLISDSSGDRRKINDGVARQSNGQVWGIIEKAPSKRSQLRLLGDPVRRPETLENLPNKATLAGIAGRLEHLEGQFRVISKKLGELDREVNSLLTSAQRATYSDIKAGQKWSEKDAQQCHDAESKE